MIISNANRLQNDSHCKLYLPFSNSVTEELSKGKSETHTVTNTGSVAITTVGGRGCASFNGTDQYLSVPDSDDFHLGSHDFTLSLWAYWNSIAMTSFIGQWENLPGGTQASWLLQYNNENLNFYHSQNGNDFTNTFQKSFTPATGTWYNLCIVRNNDNLYIFINGNSSVFSIGTGSFFNSSQSLTIGAQDGTQHLNGYLSDVQIHKGISRYLRDFTPQERGI